MLVEESFKEGVELLPSDLSHLFLGETTLFIDIEIWAVLGDQFHDPQLLSFLVRSPLILASERPFGLHVGRVLPHAVPVDNVSDRFPFVQAISILVSGRTTAILTGINPDRANLLQ